MKRNMPLFLSVVLLSALLVVPNSPAGALTIDQIIYQPSAGLDSSMLGGTATASFSGSSLTIVLTNTTAFTGGDSSTLLLTGIGFALPFGVTLTSGAANITAGSSPIGFSGTNLSGEWGSGAAQAFFVDTGAGVLAGVNYAAATQEALFLDGTPFNPALFILNPRNTVGGPDFGLLSNAFSSSGGLASVQNSITLSWNFTGISGSVLLDAIESGPVVLAFGSPTAVPEPATLLLLGSGFIGVAVVARRKTPRK